VVVEGTIIKVQRRIDFISDAAILICTISKPGFLKESLLPDMQPVCRIQVCYQKNARFHPSGAGAAASFD
jgi:hypothetical protein